MASFEIAIPYILKHEGGFVNNVNDSGGATNYGVSLRFLKDYPNIGDFDHDGDVDIEDIKNMSIEDAKQIYKSAWWDKFKYSNITDQTIATLIFDRSVNMGASRSHTILQNSLNEAFNLKLTVDGILGNASMTIINQIIDGSGEQSLITHFNDNCWKFYQDLIKSNPKNKVFENGWKNRAYCINTANSIA